MPASITEAARTFVAYHALADSDQAWKQFQAFASEARQESTAAAHAYTQGLADSAVEQGEARGYTAFARKVQDLKAQCYPIVKP